MARNNEGIRPDGIRPDQFSVRPAEPRDQLKHDVARLLPSLRELAFDAGLAMLDRDLVTETTIEITGPNGFAARLSWKKSIEAGKQNLSVNYTGDLEKLMAEPGEIQGVGVVAQWSGNFHYGEWVHEDGSHTPRRTGDHVQKGQVIGLSEIEKLKSEILSPYSGTVFYAIDDISPVVAGETIPFYILVDSVEELTPPQG